MIRHKRTIEQKFKAIVAMIVAMGLVTGFTLQDGTISDAWSIGTDSSLYIAHSTHTCNGNPGVEYDGWELNSATGKHYETCLNCSDTTKDSSEHTPVYSDAAGDYYSHEADGLDYPICRDCGYVDYTVPGKACDFIWTDTSGGNHLTHSGVCKYCGRTDSASETWFAYKSNGNKKDHEVTCNYCKAVSPSPEDCTPSSWHIMVGHKHEGVCSKCGQTVEKECDAKDADGFCTHYEPKGIAAKDAIKDLYSKAKGYGWDDSFADSDHSLNSDGEDWVNALSKSQFDELKADDAAFRAKFEQAEVSGDNVMDYMNNVLNSANALSNAIQYRAYVESMTPAYLNVADFTIHFVDKNNKSTVLTTGEVTLTSTTGTVDLKATDTVKISDTVSKLDKSGTVVTLKDGESVTITPKTAPLGYKTLPSGTYTFSANATSGEATMTPVADEFEIETGNKVINLCFEPLPEVKVELVKSDDATKTPLTSGASIQITDGVIVTPITYDIGDKIVVDSTASSDISKSGNIIIIKPDKSYTVLEGATTPSGYKWGEGTFIFKTDAAGDGNVTKTGTSTSFSVGTKKIIVQYEKIPEVTFSFFEKGTTNPLSDCSITLQSSTNTSNTVTISPSDTVIVNNLTGSTYISRTGTNEVTIRAGETFKILKGTAPKGYKNLASESGSFSSDAAGTVTVTEVSNVVKADSTTGVIIYFEAGPEYTFTVSGGGAPASPSYKLTDKLGRSYTIDGSGKAKLGDGEYELTCTNPKDDYVQPRGYFTLADGKVSKVSGDCQKTGDQGIKLVIDDQLGDLKFTLYAKKSKKDEPDTDEELKDWDYGTLYYYTGSETGIKSIKKESDSKWKSTKASIKPSSGKASVTIDMSSSKYDGFEIGGIYRMKQASAPSGYSQDSDYVYFTINEFGEPEILDGDAAADGNEVQMWNAESDEDSDDVIAIHKTNSTGGELAGAHLQIYLYSETNTLTYGSSSTTSSTTSNSSNSSNSSSSSSSSSTTTTRKTTPTKPTVSSSDVKFDWTTTDKAKTINIDDLEKGKNYTLREVSAPTGYETPAYDFVFKYGTDGKLTIVKNYNGLLSVTGNKLVLKNQTPTEAAATRPKTGDHSKLALWLDICIVMLGGLYLSGYSVVEAFSGRRKKVKVVEKKKSNNKRRR